MRTFFESVDAGGLTGVCVFILILCAIRIRNAKKKTKLPIQDTDALASFNLRWKEKLWLRIAIIESNYGRAAGWQVYLNGKQMALLTDCRFENMFWESYTIEASTEDNRVFSPQFWREAHALSFTSTRFGIAAPHAFPAGSAVSTTENPDETPTERVKMRGLYIVIPPPSFVERCILYCRKYLTKGEGGKNRV